jgi:hypothetical protein
MADVARSIPSETARKGEAIQEKSFVNTVDSAMMPRMESKT